MAINNFTSAKIAGGNLVVVGQTVEKGPDGQLVKVVLPAGAKIEGAAVAVSDESKRCKLRVKDPTGSAWTAESIEPNPFVDHDHIYAIGAQLDADGSVVLLWANELCVGAPDPTI